MWPALNASISMVVGLLMAYKLAYRHIHFSLLERVGMGLLGAGCIMTVGPILWRVSPYENWSGFLMRVGICLFFVGRVFSHDLRNR